MFENLQIEDNLPDIGEINFKSIQKSYLKLMLIKTSVIFIALMAGLTFGLMPKLNEKIPDYSYIFYLALILIFALIFLFVVLGFHKRKYAIRQKDITFKHGVLVHSMTTIPFSRIQHIEIDEGVFERILKLASLSIYTAGDNGRDLKINGLNKKEAQKIKELITNFVKDESE